MFAVRQLESVTVDMEEAFPMSMRPEPLCFRPAFVWAAVVAMGWVSLTLALPGAARAQVTPGDVGTVLERMRQAAGQAAAGRAGELLIEGTADRNGSTSDYSVRFTPAGMFLQTLAGPLPGKVGFNGKEGWSVDLSGMPERLVLYDLDRNRLLLGMQTGQWLARADKTTVAITAPKGRREEVVLDIKQGRLKAKVHVSRETWLPKSLDCFGVSGPETWTFADFRGFGGQKVPGTVTLKQAGQTETFHVKSIRPAPEAPTDVYDFVSTRPDDTRFDPAAAPGLAVKRTMTGHVLVRPKVDGQDIGWFIFDTGAAGNVIDRTALSKLKLERLGTSAVTSVLGNEQSSILQASSLVLGPMTIAKPFFVTMDLGYIRDGMREDIVGIVGHDVLARCVAEITVADDSIKLFDPKTHHLAQGSWQPLTFNQSVPAVSATFEGDRRGLFRIDMGAGGPGGVGNVVFHAPAVNELHLLKGRKVSRMKIGPGKVAMGKVAWFELAGHRFENPDVVFAIDRQGPLGDEYVQGNIGVDFLKPFRMVLDFPNQRVAFLPRG